MVGRLLRFPVRIGKLFLTPRTSMWHYRRPSPELIQRFLEEQRRLPLSFEPGTLTGFQLDEERALLGQGEAAFLAGCRAVQQWRMFPEAWTVIVPREAPLVVGQVVAVLARAFGVWWLNACRIVSVTDDVEPVRRFGFTYATLPGHVELGEELFLIEWDREGRVWYQIRAVSRPRYWLARLAYPLTRWLQRRFRRDSIRGMQAAQ